MSAWEIVLLVLPFAAGIGFCAYMAFWSGREQRSTTDLSGFLAEQRQRRDFEQHLTDEDREWLRSHGWEPNPYPTIGTERIRTMFP